MPHQISYRDPDDTSLKEVDSFHGFPVKVVEDAPIRPGRGPTIDRSGSITTGGTSQVQVPGNSVRRYLFIQNNDTVALWFNFVIPAVLSQPSIKLVADASFTMESGYVSDEPVSVIGGTTGQKFTIKEA
jgi:hypothetical protein